MKAFAISCSFSAVLGAAVMLAVPVAQAKPGGCLKYGAAGAVAGHYAHHHAVKGAVAGCATGMIVRHEYKKKMREERRMKMMHRHAPPQ